jgi:predicted RNA binding protein YcfA (HicA-like mRNA interferase family)
LTAAEAGALLVKSGFELLRTKGSHRIYGKGHRRVVVPFYGPDALHPKIVKQVFEAIEEVLPPA